MDTKNVFIWQKTCDIWFNWISFRTFGDQVRKRADGHIRPLPDSITPCKGRLKTKNFNFTNVQILRSWWPRRYVKWRWLESSSLVNVTDGLLDADGTMMDVPMKRFGGSSEEVSGMWFGPRLGKRNKRSVDSPWTVFTVRGKCVF